MLASILVTATTVACATAPAAAHAAVWCNQMAIVGDSLTAQGNGPLRAIYPEAIINARGGRVTSEAYEAALGIHEANNVDCWIFALGTNDVYFDLPPAVSQAAIMKLASLIDANDHVWWVMPEYVRGGSLSANLDPSWFINLVPSYVTPLVLNSQAADFTPDGVHLTPLGYVHRAAAIAAAV